MLSPSVERTIKKTITVQPVYFIRCGMDPVCLKDRWRGIPTAPHQIMLRSNYKQGLMTDFFSPFQEIYYRNCFVKAFSTGLRLQYRLCRKYQNFEMESGFEKNLPLLLKAKEFKFLFVVGRRHFEGLCKAILGTAPRVRALFSAPFNWQEPCSVSPSLVWGSWSPEEEHANQELPKDDETQANFMPSFLRKKLFWILINLRSFI